MTDSWQAQSGSNAQSNKSSDILGVFKDIRQTGTQELSKTAWAMLASTPPKSPATTSNGQANDSVAATLWASSWSLPSGSGNQISVAQEKREKDIIERRKEL